MRETLKTTAMIIAVALILASNYYVIAHQLTAHDIKFALAEFYANRAEAAPAEEAIPVVLSDEDREYIARVCMAEAGGSIGGMQAVAQTIRDRGDYWYMTYIDAASASGQYAEPDWDVPISEEALTAVRLTFDYQESLLEVPTTHFHADYIPDPYWTHGKTYRGTVGRNIFYY